MDIKGISMDNLINTTNMKKESVSDKNFEEILENAKKSGDDKELKKVAEEFESIFIDMMFKSMRKNIDTEDSFIEKSNARSMFESMYDEELSKEIAKSGGFGIADMIFKSLKDEE